VNERAQPGRGDYFAVIFTSQRLDFEQDQYAVMADRMAELAAQQPGYLGIESARGVDGVGITVSYWESLEAIRQWRENAEHRIAQRLGKEKWYEWFRLRIARVESEYDFNRPA
jgi:heme-degrading monooxygenase HmoA